MEIRPIAFREASRFVDEKHRHHSAPAGNKFCIGLYSGNDLHGVAICGRPSSRMIDDGFTCEVTRLCTDGIKNGCSMLYGASARIAREMGYKRIITYILCDEPGTSLKAAGWSLESDNCGGGSWSRKDRKRTDKAPMCKKQRWSKVFGRNYL